MRLATFATVMALIGLTSGSLVASPRAEASTSYVTRSGIQLLLDGQPYHFSGVNIYNANSDGWCGYQYTDAELGAAFDNVGPNGVVRAWFFQSMAAEKTVTSPGKWSGSRDWTRFDRTLLLAQQKGLRVIATLTNQWDECGDGPTAGYKTNAWYGTGWKAPDPGDLCKYDNWVPYQTWVQEVVGRYANNHPEILAWQLINEAEAKGSTPIPTASLPPSSAPSVQASTVLSSCPPAPSPVPSSCPNNATDAMLSWARDVSDLIRSLDSQHLISLGTIGTGQCGASDTEYALLHALQNIDLCEFHDYTPGVDMPGDSYNGLLRRINQCNALNKPLFVGEVGIKPVDAGGTLAGRRDRLAAKMAAQSTAGVTGHLAWAYNQRFPDYLLDGSAIGTGDPANYFDIGPGDPALATLAGAPVVLPGAPRAVTAAAGDGAVSVAWLPPSSDGGVSITQYVITSTPVGFTTTTGGLATTATLSGLTNGTSYTFTVKATNAIGTGLGSESGIVTPVPGAPPPQTTIVVVPSAGGTVATDPIGTIPSASNPLITTVTVPAGSGGGVVTIAETTVSGPPPAGYVFLAGQQVLITSTAATSVNTPLSIVFRFDPSLAPTIFRNGVAVLTACSPVGTATPTPCISSTGPGTITILTVQASTWNVGRVTPNSLCVLTHQFVQGSAKYQALSVKLRATIDTLVSAACKSLDAITAKLTAKQKTALIAAYKSGVQALVQPGWLTQTQATKLRALADAL